MAYGGLDVKPELDGMSLQSYFLVSLQQSENSNYVSTQRTYGAHGNTHRFCGMGVDVNVKILENFATHVAPALGWQPNRKGPVTGYPID